MNNKRFNEVLKTHAYKKGLSQSSAAYEQAIQNYLAEPFSMDSGKGDITSEAVLGSSKKIRASLMAKEVGVFAGIGDVEFFLKKYHSETVQFMHITDDGAQITKGMVLGVLNGPVEDILKLERTVLNFLQHMSGVATLAQQYVKACEGLGVLVCSTRKTPWGLLDKKACMTVGAGTHRLDLSDAVLVKDTHLAFINHDFDLLGKKLLEAKKLGRFVEIEVESPDDAWKAVAVLDRVRQQRKVPCFMMLDNMKPQAISTFMKKFKASESFERIFIEASGGINLENIRSFAETGVDVLSVGAMTHSAPALDISLKF